MKLAYGIVLALFLLPLCALGQTRNVSSQIEAEARKHFLRDKKRLDQRYEDFYTRIQEASRRRFKRLQHIDQHRKRRKALAEAQERRRKAFVLSRKKKKPNLAGKLAHERKLEKQQEIHRQQRARYIRSRDALRGLKKGVRRIPDRQDVGLDPAQ